MNIIHRCSIRTKLFLIIATAGLPLVLAITVLFYSQYKQEYNNAEHAIQVAAESIAQKHTAQVEGIRTQLITLSQFAEVGNKDACARLLNGLIARNPANHNIGIADSSGNVIASSAGAEANIAGSKYFKDALRTKRFSTGEYTVSSNASKPTMPFALPVLNASGAVTAVLFSVLDLDNFASIFQSQILPPNSVLNVTDHRGVLVYRYPTHPTVKPGLEDRPDLRAHMAGEMNAGVFNEIGRDNVRRILGYVRLQLHKNEAPYLYIRVSIPENQVLRTLHRHLYLAGALLALMTAITLVCSTFLAKRFLVAPIQRLVEVARSVKDGDLSVRTGYTHADNEIGMLAQSFDAMAESMEERQQSLRASEQKFSSVFYLSPITMALTSYPDGVLVEVNRAFGTIFGYSREEAIGKSTEELKIWTDPKDRNCFFQMIEKDNYVSSFETVMMTRSGSPVTVEFTGSKIDISGHSYLLNSVVDITERKNAEKALLESEKRFKEFFVQSGDAFLIVDDGQFTDCNQATVKMLEYQSKNDVLQRTPAELSPERQPDGQLSYVKAAKLIDMAFSTGTHRFEWSHLKADGSRFPVEVVLTSMSLSEKTVLHVVWRDIT